MAAAANDNPTTLFATSAGANPSVGSPGSAPSLEGQILNESFRVESKLGEGGMGTVYRGTQLSLSRAVAIKTISPSSQLTEAMTQRFLREAKILSQLNHPNIVSIIDFGTAGPGAMPFMVMELLFGKPLDAHITPGNRPGLRQILNWMMQICSGIGAAHHANIVHRDLKPSNVFIVSVEGSADSIVKLLDFGLAKPATRMPDSGLAITQAGVGVGTCGFTAPEQLEGSGEPDARADVYGLGALLYFMLTGRPPYQGQTLNSVMAKQMTRPPDPIDFPALGHGGAESLEPVLHKAMSILPQDRYQSVAEFKGALEAILTGILSHADYRGTRVGVHDTQTGQGTPTQVGTPRPAAPTEVALASAMPRARAARALLVGAALLLVAGGVAGWLAFGGKKNTGGSADGGGTRPSAAGGETNTPAQPTLTATAPGVSASDITLGISAPFSGPAKELGRDMQTGIETYFQYVNESAGGIHGRNLKLLALDDGYEPKRCAETMKAMLGQRAVFAFLGNVGTPTAEVALPMVLENKRLFFGAFTGAGLLRRDPPDRYVFNYRASYAEETAAIVHYLLTVRKILPEQIAVFAQQDGYGDAGFSGVAKAVRKVGFDSDRNLRVGYPRNSMDLDPAVTALLKRKEQIKAVVMVPTYRQAAAFIRRVKDEGMNPIFTSFVGSNALAEALKELGAKYAQGVIITQVVPFYVSSATGVLQYRERLAKYFPAEQPGFVSLEGYLAAKVLCEGLDKAGPELTTEKLVEALENIRGRDFGIGTTITFGPSEHQGSHKVWATVLDANCAFQSLELD
jgi:serine/threonine protein kinase/ABC-type branched-subunit amino acid transport system substrate-binding protein